jgi:hypothetical protein
MVQHKQTNSAFTNIRFKRRYMALPSGIYTIENVKHHNWAMLFDANEGEVVAGSSPKSNVGEKVRSLEM